MECGDVVAVYVEDVTEQIMLGRVMRTQYEITSDDAVYTWMGQMLRGDQVLYVHKLDPTANGISSRYWKLRNPAEPCAQFPVWIEDIRAVKIKLTEDKVRRGRSVTSSVNPIDVRWEISSEERERYITTLPLVMKDGENDDPHARQRARAQFEVHGTNRRFSKRK